MPNKLFSLPKPKPNLSRNGFDKSRRDTFSIRLGELLPVFVEETVPDSYYEIDLSNYLQTLPLFTNSFTRLKQNVDFYFVPYTAIMSKFDQFYNGRVYNTQANNTAGVDFVPCFNLGQLLDTLAQIDTYYRIAPPDASMSTEDMQECIAGTCKLLDMLGYGSYYSMYELGHFGLPQQRPDEYTGASYGAGYLANHTYQQRPNLFRLAAYQLIWNCFYRNKYWDTRDYVKSFNFDDLFNDTITHSDVMTSRQGILIENATQASVENSIWFQNPEENPFALRYRGYKKDRFVGMFPTPQYLSVSKVEMDVETSVNNTNQNFLLLQNGVIKYKPTISRYVARSSGGSADEEARMFSTGSATTTNLTSSFDVYALRKAQMVQKWREYQLRAGNVTSDQMESMFGKRPRFIRDMEPVFLGSYDSPIKISEVISTANTSSPQSMDYSEYSNLGERAGKADSGISGNKISFKASDFGVIIGVMSIVPENEYNALMIDDANTFSVKEDFFNPMYENLGFVEQPFYSLVNFVPTGDGLPNAPDGQVDFNRILGYVPRYTSYKTAIDKVHGRFLSGFSNVFAYGISSQGVVNTNAASTYGDYYFYNSPRNDIQFNFNQNSYLRQWYINPSLMRPVFVDQSEEENFLVCQYCDVKAIQPMSELGLPQW